MLLAFMDRRCNFENQIIVIIYFLGIFTVIFQNDTKHGEK